MGQLLESNLEALQTPTAYDTLCELPSYVEVPDDIYDKSQDVYDRYLRMHKVLVGRRGAEELESIYFELRDSVAPRLLSAAGWAAAEVALIGGGRSQDYRLSLLDGTEQAWTKAMNNQKFMNASEHKEMEYAVPHRIALDLATLPLIRALTAGRVDTGVRNNVFKDCLNIAESNIVYLDIASKDGDIEAIASHVGFAFECNALLAFNRHLMHDWFIIPGLARADSGIHYRHQTHDLMVVQQRQGRIEGMLPIEVKSRASVRDRKRYKALLVRGKMHLSVEGKHKPEQTLEAISADFEGHATLEQKVLANTITEDLMAMIREYRAGEKLGHLASSRSLLSFHDNARVVSKFAGLAVPS